MRPMFIAFDKIYGSRPYPVTLGDSFYRDAIADKFSNDGDVFFAKLGAAMRVAFILPVAVYLILSVIFRRAYIKMINIAASWIIAFVPNELTKRYGPVAIFPDNPVGFHVNLPVSNSAVPSSVCMSGKINAFGACFYGFIVNRANRGAEFYMMVMCFKKCSALYTKHIKSLLSYYSS